MGDTNITLKTPDGIFNYRVGAIIINSETNSILMVKNENSPYYYSVGGRVTFGESAQEAVLREAFEETQIQFDIERLAFIHENFFTMNNEPFHEIAFFYLMKPNDKVSEIKNNSFKEYDVEETLNWLPINNLDDIYLHPEFFKTELKSLSTDVKHFVTRDEITFRL
jgi:ADP-ribose pyrophosphatase YjhB (NUDIX family)